MENLQNLGAFAGFTYLSGIRNIFEMKMRWTGRTGPVDDGRATVYGSVMDNRRWWPNSSLESDLAPTPVGQSLSQVG
jgi:hypothetical protein